MMKKKPFNLPDLIVVIAILGILSSIVVARLGHRAKAVPEVDMVKEIYQELQVTQSNIKKDGIAIALLIDSSGSMATTVKGMNNAEQPKIDIARETARNVIMQIKRFAGKNKRQEIKVGIYSFGGDDIHGVKTILDMDTVAPDSANQTFNNLSAKGNTPLGEAIIRAKKELDLTGLNKEHIIIISDGLNTVGRLPIDVMRGIRLLPAEVQPITYLITFDAKADLFNDLKSERVLVLEAGNAKELNQTMDFVLNSKILVEQPL